MNWKLVFHVFLIALSGALFGWLPATLGAAIWLGISAHKAKKA